MRRLSTQLLISHVILVLLMAIVMSSAVGSMIGLSENVQQLFESNLTSVEASGKIGTAVREEALAAVMMIDKHPASQVVYTSARADLANALRLAGDSADSPEDFSMVASLNKDAKQIDGLFRLVSSSANVAARQAAFNQLMDTAGHAGRTAADMAEQNYEATEQEKQIAAQKALNASRLSALYTFIALAAAILLAWRMVRLALRPLALLAKQAEVIGSGELSNKLEIDRKDEIGALADSFNDMATRLAGLRKQEEKRLRRAQKMTDFALESLYDPVIIADARGRIVHLNRAAQEIFGPAPESPRAPVVEHIGDERIVRAIRKAIEQQTVSATEDETAIVPLKVEGGDRTYRLRAAPMKDDDGTLLGSVVVLEDITHLRQLDRLKTEFIGVASHELRTPITSLLLSNELMAEGAAGQLSPEQRTLVSAQSEDLQRLEKLTRELLDLTRMEAGTTAPVFDMVPAGQLAKSAANSVKNQAAEKGVDLVEDISEGLPDVRADKSQIIRVLVNLLNNAIRHTPSGGTVTVRATPRANQVTFEVADTGEGIPPEYLAKIFDRFVQVPGATQGGAGLGLSIAQRIVKAHGSVMQVKSELGKGSSFSFSITTNPASDGEKRI